MPKEWQAEGEEKLVPLNVLVPEGIKAWISEMAYTESSPELKVSVAAVARRLLEEIHKEYLQKQIE